LTKIIILVGGCGLVVDSFSNEFYQKHKNKLKHNKKI